jgi:antitoxin (DNA-binding transcriptional repressor) of toxin-antitoxin stability system
MKVRIGELKTHLSKYVQGLREGGEPVEVCVRDEAVAYLTAAAPGESPGQAREMQELARRLEASGLRLRAGTTFKETALPPLGRAGDGRRVKNSVSDMRSGKDW